MNCNEFKNMISPYIDNQLNEIEKKDFELHLLECDKCKKIYEENLKIVSLMRNKKESPLPKDYKTSLRYKLEEEKKDKKRMNFNYKWISVAAMILFVMISIPLFGKILYNNNNMIMEDAKVEENAQKSYGKNESNMNINKEASEEPMMMSDSENNKVSIQKRKIIKNAYITLEIENYTENMKDITRYVNKIKGYIENSNVNNIERENDILTEGNLSLRVPENHFDETLEHLRGLGNVKNERINSNDITKNYIDMESRLKNLRVQEERLRELIKKANKVQDILSIENELRRIRTEIEQITSNLENLNNLSSMSTINVHLIEVESLSTKIQNVDKNIILKAKEGFISSINKIIEGLQWGFIKIATILPLIIIIIIISMMLWLILKKRGDKK